MFAFQTVQYVDAQYHGIGYMNSGPVIKWWSESQSVNQKNGDQNTKLPWHMSSEPFDNPTNPHDLNPKKFAIQIPTVLR